MELSVGATASLSGDVTTLNWIKPASAALIERDLGYQPGRLSRGYLIALLKRRPAPGDFDFAGLTIHSGGRFGKPGHTPAEEAARERVMDALKRQYGAVSYEQMKTRAAATAQITGAKRLVKILPTIRHDAALPAAVQYPMGSGGPQWTLTSALPFLIAAHVAPDGTATAQTLTVNLKTGGYDAVHKLMHHLQVA